MNNKELQVLKDAYDLIGGLIGDNEKEAKKNPIDDLPGVLDAIGGKTE